MATSVPTVPGKLGKSRSCCWTLNNYHDDDIIRLRHYGKNSCRYMVFGYEVAPGTGTPHLQGYVSWENPRSLDAFKLEISQRLHLEKTRGTPKQASDYCKEDGKFEEFGELPRQGERTDWCVAISQIQSGIPVEEVIENQPQLLPCIRALDTFKARQIKPLHREVTVYVLWGDAGTGKSRWAYDNYPELYSKPPGKWWDGYLGQKTILLDDFYGYIPYTELLNVLDRYPYHAEVKNGYVWAQWDTVIITSNKPPNLWYKGIGLTPALQRRLNKISFYGIDGKIEDASCPPEAQSRSA
ncbi:putative rep protein [Garrulus glandarius associated circular virus 1]|uniref:putative rep protein n=1 Tax=Garrulus glandarius associated circular virus 1 TaxID=2006642 RepID=UPI000B5C18BD|nr:putative rep protein [Garrulus glandarius associated circular virus 1]ARV76501.1 putative rep protein [Garrulus glandarius associated circular virus 1]AZQ25385.1 putative rep [Garrulus glandarius associated circular virus 1]